MTIQHIDGAEPRIRFTSETAAEAAALKAVQRVAAKSEILTIYTENGTQWTATVWLDT